MGSRYHKLEACEQAEVQRSHSGKNGTWNHTRKLDEGEQRIAPNPMGGKGSAAHGWVSESGLYTLIMRSDKDTARPFQDWVTKGDGRTIDPPSSRTAHAVLERFSEGAP